MEGTDTVCLCGNGGWHRGRNRVALAFGLPGLVYDTIEMGYISRRSRLMNRLIRVRDLGSYKFARWREREALVTRLAPG
jgi:hypothetical protein